MSAKTTIKNAVLKYRSLQNAIRFLRENSRVSEVEIEALEAAAEALSELQSQRGKMGEKNSLPENILAVIDAALKKGEPHADIAKRVKVSRMSVWRRSKVIKL
jgi:DNA-directed RNA polymerase specialized sigma subunit